MRHPIIVSLAVVLTIGRLGLAVCGAAGGSIATLEADNGERFRIIDVHVLDNSWRGGDKPYVSAGIVNDNEEYFMVTFDCAGSFARGDGVKWRPIPSHSVAAKIADVACKRIKR